MKKLILCAVLCLPFFLKAQNYVLQTQSEVDNWSATSAFSITIQGPLITSLAGLSILEDLGELTIENTTALESLDGLEGLSGSYVEQLRIESNQALVDASAIEGISTNFCRIIGNPVMTTLGAFGNQSILMELYLQDNPSLVLGSAFSELESVSGSFIYYASDLLGFPSLTYAPFSELKGDQVSGLEGLTSFEQLTVLGVMDFPNITEINTLNIRPGAIVNNFAGLPNLTSIQSIRFFVTELDEGYDFNTTFSDLPQLESFNTLHIIGHPGGSPEGISLEGLEWLTNMNEIVISRVDNEIGLQGIQNVEVVFEELTLFDSSFLTDLSTFANLNYVGYLNVQSNPNLSVCCGFNPDLLVLDSNIQGNNSDECNNLENWFSNCGILGCTQAEACNYNPEAEDDDGSCAYPGSTCDDMNEETENDIYDNNCECAGTEVQEVYGCLYPSAINYNPDATIDDLSCIFPNCLSGDLDGDSLIGVNDLLILLSNFGQTVE